MDEANNKNDSDPKTAKAEAKAAAAKAKALRPWFKKKRFIVPLALVILIIISAVTNGGNQETVSSNANNDNSSETSNNTDNNQSSETSNNSDTNADQGMPSIGDPVVSGNFTFTVNAVECGIPGVGNDTFGQEAQGEFCKINIRVENTGTEADYFAASSQVVKDEQGRKFEADTSAMIYLEEGDDVWLGADINPGNSAEVAILYDMPVGVAPASITLVDGFFSSGVEVSLK